jgi:hypothetical protein
VLLKSGACAAFSASWRNKLTAILSFALWLMAAVAPVSAEETGWVLTQRSARLGDQYLYVSEHGVKMVNPKLGITITCRAPGYELYVCNSGTRNYYETTADAWKHQAIARQGNTDFSGTSGWRPTGTTVVAGLPSAVYTLEGSWVRRRANGRTVVSDSKGATYCLATGIRVPPKLCELLSTAIGVPSLMGVPVRLAIRESGGIRSILDTYRCDRAPLTAAYFAKPLGYRKVATDAEVMLSAEDDKMIQDMAHSLGNSSTSNDALAKAAAQYSKGGAGPSADEIKSAIEAYKRNQGH